jgi:uroporphyrin-III C-methyltransferase
VTVYLVGAGPGDPDLLTLKAARLLATADVVVVDRLVDDRIRGLARPGARVIDVGKRPGSGDPRVAQERINELLIKLGRSGSPVVRLKGGDPFVFGRGGEELGALHAAGVDVQVVPGVTSALGLPTLAGIPVTHRGTASAVLVASGHDVDALVTTCAGAATTTTIVLLMAVENRDVIAKELLAYGRDPSTPVAILERGATDGERRLVTTLDHLGSKEVNAPAVIVIGAVAAFLDAAIDGS